MLSRSPSPNKSPRRIPLSSKDSNIINTSLLKSSTPKLSPSKTNHTCSLAPSRSNSHSPTKPVSPLKNPVPSLGFVIYSDPKDYSTELALSSCLKIQDENELTQNKENLAPLKLEERAKPNSKRRVLGDLDISEYRGFVKFHNNHLKPIQQLDTFWTNDNTLSIPSYVTPPRNTSKRIKYVGFENNSKEEPSHGLKRSNSLSDVKDKVVKKLVFDIHNDKLAL